MESLFATEKARRKRLPPAMRRLIVDLKAEYPALNLSEIANIGYVRFGRRPEVRTVRRVLEEEPIPLKILKRFAPYHEIEEAKERRMVIVKLHAEGWSVKAIAGYLRITRDTVYKTLRSWIEEGEAGLEDKKRGRPKGVSKVDLKAIDAVRRLQRVPQPRRVSGTRCARADRHPPEPQDVWEDPCPKPQALRLRQAQEEW
jgi:hypothetical protein